MGGTTNSQALRFPYVDEGIAASNIANLAADIATKLDVQDATRTAVIARPVVSVSRNASQAIAVNTDVTIIWDVVSVDTAGLVNLGTQPTRITVPASATGLWRVSLSGALVGPSWTRTTFTYLVSGAARAAKTFWGTDFGWTTFSTMINVSAANDFIEVRIRHAGGGTDVIAGLTLTAHPVAKT